MASRRVSRLLWTTALAAAAFFAAVPREAAALAVADSRIGFGNLAITPSAGTFSLVEPWSIEAFAHADNSLGQSDSQFTPAVSPGAATAVASETWANASGRAVASGDPPSLAVAGSASSNVNIPGCSPGAAFSNGRGTLSNFFTPSGGDDSVDVGFAIDISGALNLMTDACGIRAFTETVFTLAVDGLPVLFDLRFHEIGPSDAYN